MAGVALGFGAQTLVRDFLSGLFIVIEDQFGVGDTVDLQDVAGTVEEVSLRSTEDPGRRRRALDGVQRRDRQGGQRHQGLVPVEARRERRLRQRPPAGDGAHPRGGRGRCARTRTGGLDILEPPEMWGVEQLAVDGVTIRLVVKTRPGRQYVVTRELQLRIKERLETGGHRDPLPAAHPLGPSPRGRGRPARRRGRSRAGLNQTAAPRRHRPGVKVGRLAVLALSVGLIARVPGGAGRAGADGRAPERGAGAGRARAAGGRLDPAPGRARALAECSGRGTPCATWRSNGSGLLTPEFSTGRPGSTRSWRPSTPTSSCSRSSATTRATRTSSGSRTAGPSRASSRARRFSAAWGRQTDARWRPSAAPAPGRPRAAPERAGARAPGGRRPAAGRVRAGGGPAGRSSPWSTPRPCWTAPRTAPPTACTCRTRRPPRAGRAPTAA